MIARITEHHQLPADLDPEYVERHRQWIASQPGFCGGYHLFEEASGHAISLTLWESAAALDAIRQANKSGPGDRRISSQSEPDTRIVAVAAIF
jgi:heme-degrading monooxygenase HmoA